MPRLKKISYELRKRTVKMRRRRERELSWQLRHDDTESRLDNEYCQLRSKELEDAKDDVLSSFPSEWTESSNGVQSSQHVDRGHTSVNFGEELASRRGLASHVADQHPSQSGVSGGNPVDGGYQIKEEQSSPAGEEIREDNQTEEMKVDDVMGLAGKIKEEPDLDGDSKKELTAVGNPQDQMAHPADDAYAENFVVDCDPMIVTNPGLSTDATRPLSSDDNSCYSSSSSNQFFADIMKNNELFYKQMANSPNTMNDAELARALQDHYDKLETINEELYDKRKKAASIQRRRRKRMLEKMTEEQLKEYRATQTEACRQRRIRRLARMSEEERQRDRMLKNALCLARRHRREAQMSEEERKSRRAAAAAAQREKRKRKRANMTEEELKAHKAEVAAIWRMRRHLRYMRMSEEERQAERAKAAEAKRISRQRQKEKENSGGEMVQTKETPRRPRRRRARSQVSLSESESDVLESNNYGIDCTAETLISQILKQTQQIAAIESQDGDLVPQPPLAQLSKDQSLPEGPETYLLPHELPEDEPGSNHPPKVTDETYLLPHEIPDKEPDAESKVASSETYLLPHERPDPKPAPLDHHPKVAHQEVKQETTYLLPQEMPEQPDADHYSKMAQGSKQEAYLLPHKLPEKHGGEEPSPKGEQEIKQDSYVMQHKLPEHQLNSTPPSKVAHSGENNRHEMPHQEFSHRVQDGRDQMQTGQLYPHQNMEDGSHPPPPGNFYSTKSPMSGQMDPPPPPPHLHHRPPESDPMSVAHQYHHGIMHYNSRATPLHPYHLGSIQSMGHPGPVQQFHQSENQDNQTGVIQQYIHGRNYMNTLY